MRHAFLRTAKGKFTSYEIPGESIPSQACYSLCLNALGEVTAPYVDQGSILHGYLRKPSGQIINFDPPGAVNGTYPTSINPEGAIVGIFWDAVSTEHGFVRSRDGSFTTYDVPGAAGTEGYTNNALGEISGDYFDPSGVYHGFLRARGGDIITFDVPGAGTDPGEGTFPQGLNDRGAVPGFYCDAVTCHGFVRHR